MSKKNKEVVENEEVKKDKKLEKKEKVKKEEPKKVEKKEKVKKKEPKKVEKKEKVKKKEPKKTEKKEKVESKEIEKRLKKPNTEKIVILSIVIGVLVIAFGLFGYYFYNTNARSVATFDGGSVSTADFTVYYKTFAPILEYYGYPASMIPEQIVNKAGIDMIILKQAKEADVTLSDEDKAKVDEIFNDKEQVQQFINEGIDVAKMKQLYYNDYTITAYIEKLKQDAKDEDVIAYIKKNSGEDADLFEYNTSHILFKTIDDNGATLSEEEQAKVKEKAEAALKRALAGEDFATLAKELSEDTGTKEDGGKYVMYMDGSTYTEYADAVKTLQVGQVTATLVKSQSGYHIIKLNEKIENGRAHNDREREEYVDEDINKLSETKNLNIDKIYLTKLVEKITGKKVETTTEEDTDTVNDSTTTENTENTENTTNE